MLFFGLVSVGQPTTLEIKSTWNDYLRLESWDIDIDFPAIILRLAWMATMNGFRPPFAIIIYCRITYITCSLCTELSWDAD